MAQQYLSDEEVFGTHPAADRALTDREAFGVTDPSRRSAGAAMIRQKTQDVLDSVNTGLTVRNLREQMAPEPGWVRSGVLPIATKEVSPGEGAASQGWKFDIKGPVNSMLSPMLDLLEGTGLETSVGGPNARLAGKVSPEASMLLLGSRLGNPVQQFRNPLGPAGRDIQFGQPTMAEAGPVLQREAPLSPEFQQAPIAPGAAQKIAETPQGAPVSGEPAAPVGGAVGADVTTAPIPPKTHVERVADLQKAVQQTAEDRAGPRLVDETPYVEGIPPRLLAGRDFSTSTHALDEKVAIAKDPLFRDRVETNQRLRNEGMVELLRNDAGDAITLDSLHEARAKVSPHEMRVFENETPVDASGLLAQIDNLLAGPEGKQKAVRTTLKDVRDSLFDADGNLEVLPSRLYGARKNLTDLLKRGVKGTGDLADDVRASKHHLEGLLPEFDPLITQGAARFTEYLKAWSELSKPIDAQEFLQRYQFGPRRLTNGAGYLQPDRVLRMLNDVLAEHQAPGVSRGKSLTDQQIANIEKVKNELQAQQLQDRRASVRGSDTFQQIERRMMGEGPIAQAARNIRDVGLAFPSAGIYNYVIKPGLEANRERRIGRRIDLRKQELLGPPRNELGP
jgi:hypothetical protein